MTIIRKLTLNHTGVVMDASASTPFKVKDSSFYPNSIQKAYRVPYKMP